MELTSLVFKEVQQCLCKAWLDDILTDIAPCILLHNCDCVAHPAWEHVTANVLISAVELIALPAEVMTITLSHSIQQFCEALHGVDDEVVQYKMSVLDLCDDLKILLTASRLVIILIGWLPIFQHCGKHCYVQLVLNLIDFLFADMSYPELEEQGQSKYVWLHGFKRCIAMDDFCELLNYLIKRLPSANMIELMASKSAGIMLLC